MSPRGPSRASKTNKATFSKKWFSRWTVCIFSLLRPPKRASRGPRRPPRGTQGAPKPQKKGIQKWTPKLTIFGPILGPFWGPFWGQNGLQNLSKTGSFLGPVFGPVFLDFEILEGSLGILRGYTLSGKVPRAASRAVLFTNYQAPSIQGPVPFTKHPTDLTRPGPRAGELLTMLPCLRERWAKAAGVAAVHKKYRCKV